MIINIDSRSVIALDLDDTLFKEVDFVRSAFMEIARDISPDGWTALYQDMFGMFREKADVFQFIETHYRISKESLLETYRNHVPAVGLSPVPRQVIMEIKSNGGKAGIITDGRIITQNNKLSALGIQDLLDFKIISEATGYDKTHEHNFKLVEDLYPGHEFTYIADNPSKDFIHPNRLGWKTIGILDHGAHIHSQISMHSQPEFLPEHWINDLGSLRISC